MTDSEISAARRTPHPRKLATVSAGVPTGADVALVAGTSREAVSQILNGHADRFRPETVTKVMNAVRELGYRPSAAGRALRLGRSAMILALIANETRPRVAMTNLRQLGKTATKHNLTLVACLAPRGLDELHQLLIELRPSVAASTAGFSNEEATLISHHGVITLDLGIMSGGETGSDLWEAIDEQLDAIRSPHTVLTSGE